MLRAPFPETFSFPTRSEWDWLGMDWAGLRWIRLVCLDQTGLDLAVDWTELDRMGSGWMSSVGWGWTVPARKRYAITAASVVGNDQHCNGEGSGARAPFCGCGFDGNRVSHAFLRPTPPSAMDHDGIIVDHSSIPERPRETCTTQTVQGTNSKAEGSLVEVVPTPLHPGPLVS